MKRCEKMIRYFKVRVVHNPSLLWNMSAGMTENSSMTYGCFLKWWYPTTMDFPTKNDHFGVFWGYHLRKHPYRHLFIQDGTNRFLRPPAERWCRRPSGGLSNGGGGAVVQFPVLATPGNPRLLQASRHTLRWA